ncbi:MAG TPA: DNA-directed DNA polymerase [Methanocella sp.]|nr:DNA-directed DNA polymerase [Methanocella sp.]
MKFRGWLLDADYIVENDRPVIRMWCLDDQGRTAVLFDRTFEPYFYVIPYGEVPIRAIEDLSDVVGGEVLKPVRVDVVDRKNFGSPVRCYRIFTQLPRDVPYLREQAAKFGDVREADILFGVRYIIDRRLIPLGGIEAEGEPVDVEYAETGLLCTRLPLAFAREEEPPVKVLAFDCEMYNPHGMPSAKTDPIVLISVKTGKGQQVFEAQDNDDRTVLKEFIRYVREYDPDIIVGYNQDAFDWPYIHERAKLHKIKLSVSRDGTTPMFGRGGLQKKVKLIGRLNVDLYQVAARDVDGIKIKTLDNVADYLGVMKKDERVNLSGAQVCHYWADPARRETLVQYCLDDAISTYGLARELLPLQYEFARMVREPLDNVSKMGRGRQVEAYLAYAAYGQGELIPSRGGEVETYAGGFVFEPVKGLHRDVAALDFSAMYPSIMINYNISPDTVCLPGEQEGCSAPAPEVGYRFRRTPEGFFTTILKGLVSRRSALKKKLATLDHKGHEYRLLDIRQKTIKILTNAFYGYTGWAAARWYRRECAEATSAWGRYFIKKANDIALEMGLEVLYGDTDSLFVRRKGGGDLRGTVRPFIDRVKRELPLDMDVDNYYRVIFFTESKKRYAGLNERGEIIVRGLEVRRGDWCDLAKELQSEVIRIILEEEKPEKAMKYAKDVVARVKEGRVPLPELVIHKTLTKSVTRYESAQAHVKAAERAMGLDMASEVGNKVSYVIVKGPGILSDRAYPVEMFDKFEKGKLYAKDRTYEIDADYYVDKQLVPTAMRILGYFGYSEDELKGKSVQGTLEAFF